MSAEAINGAVGANTAEGERAFRKGDVCSLATLLRRAPVDLATCDLSKGVAVSRLKAAGTPGVLIARCENPAKGIVETVGGTLYKELLSDLRPLDAYAPTCPPGHIMIGDRAVPRGMTDAPMRGQCYWFPGFASSHPETVIDWYNWDGDEGDRARLRRGLIHSTEAAARTHAEALIALSAGEG